MNEDFSEILNTFSEILKEKNINIDEITCKTTDENNHNSIFQDDFIDIETIIRIKEILSDLEASNNSPRNNLLYSLKPYLENNKKEKLDKYIQLANLLNIMDKMNFNIPFLKNNKKGYDFILIITLILLII